MASGDYTRGEMDIEAQKKMYDGAMKAFFWGTFITALGLAYSIFTLSIGMNWMVALALCAGTGIVIGLAMDLGGAWIATVIALTGLAIILQIIITLFAILL